MSIQHIFRRGLLSSVAWSFMVTMLRAGAAIFMLPLLLRMLPSEQLGMWYLFSSLGTFAALLDVGIGPMATRVAGYFLAGAKEIQAFGVVFQEVETGQQPNFPALRDLAATLRRYYGFLGLAVFFILLFGGGAWIWYKSAPLPGRITARGAYLVWCFACLLNFTGDLWPNLLSGLGHIRAAQQIAFVSLLVYYLTAAGGLLFGASLWALAVATLLMGLTVRQAGRVIVQRHLNGNDAGSPTGKFRMDLLRTLWPNAWRFALLSLGGFLIVQANTLICSGFLNLKTTASYGLTMQVASLLSSLSTSWVTVKFPMINQLRVQQRDREIARLFATRVRLALLTYIAGAIAFLFVGPRFLALLHSRTQWLSFGPLCLLLITQFLEMHHALYGGLVFTENRNPFLRPTLISGGMVVLLSCILTPRYGTWGLVLSATIVQLCFNNWWTVWRGVSGLRVAPRDYWKYFFGINSL